MEEVKWLISKSMMVEFAIGGEDEADDYLDIAEQEERESMSKKSVNRPVTIVKAGGVHLGFSMMKNPTTTKGPAIKSVTVGGIADGKLFPGDVIITANGTNVQQAGDSHRDLGCLPYISYGVKYIDPVSPVPFPGQTKRRACYLRPT